MIGEDGSGRPALGRHPPSDVPYQPTLARCVGRILVIDHKTPTPDVDSGSASMFSYPENSVTRGVRIDISPRSTVRLIADTRMRSLVLGIKTLSATRMAVNQGDD